MKTMEEKVKVLHEYISTCVDDDKIPTLAYGSMITDLSRDDFIDVERLSEDKVSPELREKILFFHYMREHMLEERLTSGRIKPEVGLPFLRVRGWNDSVLRKTEVDVGLKDTVKAITVNLIDEPDSI